MGVTIHYRGQLADLNQLEKLEDLVIDLVLELGGRVEVWRSAATDDPERVVRGLMVNVEPGQETMSLLFSPEGWLIRLFEIEEVERGSSGEESWCFVKTQFGTPVGHAAVIELLTILRDRFMPSLDVIDESGYWEHREPEKLIEAISRTGVAIDALASALEETSMSHEALEDPEIVATRIERIAKVVHGRLREQTVAQDSDDGAVADFTKRWPEIEADWQELVRQNDARARRRLRELEERLLAGDDPQQAFDEACAAELSGGTGSERDPERDLEPSYEYSFADSSEFEQDDDGALDKTTDERDPLLQRATGLYMRLIELVKTDDSPRVTDLLRHAGEVCGGLAQALPLPPPYDFDPDERGLAAAQLKRALRGAAFLRGALINLAYTAAAERGPYDSAREEVEAIQSEIVDCLQRTRPAPDD